VIRSMSLLALGVSALLSLAGQASAQIIVPGGKVPPIDGIPPQLQKQLQEIFQRAAAGQGQPGIRGGKAGMRWGGLRLEKASPELQTQLGLEANEGLVIAAVDPNSVGAKAGVKASDVLLKIGATPVPNDAVGFAKLVKDQKENEPLDLVVIRNGKEQTIKAAKMPALVQNVVGPGGGIRGGGGFGGLGGIGGAGGAPGLPGMPGIAFGGLQTGKLKKLHVELEIDGAEVIRDQDGDTFSGKYVKGDLKITLSGKLENGQSKISEITIQEGKDSKKYTSPKEVPAQHRAAIQQMLPSPFTNLMIMPAIPNLQGFPGLPDVSPFFDKR